VVIKRDDPELFGKVWDIPVPTSGTDRESHNQHQRLASAMFFVIEVDPVRAYVGHTDSFVVG
jgi:hypothetical protein